MPAAPPYLEAVLTALRSRGPSTAVELCGVIGISQATFSRTIHAADGIVVAGAARSTRYAARRTISGLPESLSVYEIGIGAAVLVATLHPIQPRGFLVESASSLAGFYDDLPWFINDLRPVGFLGRQIPRRFPSLGLPGDVRHWNGDHVLTWLNFEGVDVVGNLAVGGTCLTRALNPQPVASGSYAQLAELALADGPSGSSAGGEQPKFLTTRDGVPVLVKFSPAVVDAPSRRVADLLRAEHLALTHVAAAGIGSARSRIVEEAGRVFLEVERFDRVGMGGRTGVVSLLSLDSEFVGSLRSWSETVVALRRQRRISDASMVQAIWLDRFGALIGNTDRHHGNLSFRFEHGVLGELAPAYDMLPMHFHPRGGAVVDVPMPLPTLTADHGDLWRSAYQSATRFWSEVPELPGISDDFVRVARESGAAVETLGATIARLPA